jgi:spermidine synthase
MAVIWSRAIEANHYEVRSAGATLRLYRNGVHHSQFNPNRPLGGGIWDLLVLPALYRTQGSCKDALILGFGAGAAGRVLAELVKPERIVGVELDPIHLTIADGFFECSQGCELIAADAVEWMRGGAEGSQFDYILDDLYAEESGLPIRCAPMDIDWFHTLAGRLRPDGILLMNVIEPEKLPFLPPMQDQDLCARFPHVWSFRIEGYENRIVAFTNTAFDRAQFEANMHRICRRFPRCSGVGKAYQVEILRA